MLAVAVVEDVAELLADDVAEVVLFGEDAERLGEVDVGAEVLDLYLHVVADEAFVGVADVHA